MFHPDFLMTVVPMDSNFYPTTRSIHETMAEVTLSLEDITLKQCNPFRMFSSQMLLRIVPKKLH